MRWSQSEVHAPSPLRPRSESPTVPRHAIVLHVSPEHGRNGPDRPRHPIQNLAQTQEKQQARELATERVTE